MATKAKRKKKTAVQEVRLCDVSGLFPMLSPEHVFHYRVFQLHHTAYIAVPIGSTVRRRDRMALRFLIHMTQLKKWNVLGRLFDRALKAASETEANFRNEDFPIKGVLLGPWPA